MSQEESEHNEVDGMKKGPVVRFNSVVFNDVSCCGRSNNNLFSVVHCF